MPNERILVVVVEEDLLELIRYNLSQEGYRVTCVETGEAALSHAARERTDLIVLDLMLPGEDGHSICERVRAAGFLRPILMLTARDATEDVVRGLNAGADDYLTKPFKFDELLARIRALLRRGGAARLDRLSYGALELDRPKHQARANGVLLDITPREFNLLEHFLLHPEEVVRRTELLEKVWDMHFDPGSNVVDVHVGNLRRKLREAGCDGLIQTVRGVGFCLKRLEAARA